ncbi:MAG: FemAB family protein [Candidatus Daviesbacteria bacterium GW2011_GWA1_41_61]|uniref:FemAB family protein n=1 Tax=Candidatus Daviesbacteria bacterium GW2011_GWA2_40_9 TaxID=1618424 RepID=A0A0G0WGK8_9BACT|nr:MAG: FemAB family protein [Candidatus Daviesbacteria bacterium GW2011_GWC1_40_9]KKR83435.1 MAG: FemAB family protein [Candidatus Daviesbacteria bacterium GW2011_GWA2_40_9]KKR93817.1 MAG: FemAB family protein [Candidatus Daviesbacteria bacterium GW2011_GWB1_41_15]KKS15283.1 MAG: FemAB family protein [Candidatus Daviesbacteria bacterium GW2011_GWA1_41_61]
MDLKLVTDQQKKEYNSLVTHIMQSWQWGEFRQSLGTKVKRYGLYKNGKMVQAFQLTFHKIPLSNSYIGYLPKGPFPDENLAQALKKIAQEERCAFIKVEPDVEALSVKGKGLRIDKKFKVSPKPLFTKYNYLLDLTQPEEEILKKMHPKFRYNIKVAQKHGVKVEERTDDQAFAIYLKLHFATTQRQGFLSHTHKYHRQVWETLKQAQMARLLIAFYQPSDKKEPLPLNAWMITNFKDTLYYPYGGSLKEYKNVMAPTLTAWEAIKLGKKLKLKKFDLWGGANPNLGAKDPYFGFSRLKENLGAELVEYIGTYDLVFNPLIYILINTLEKFNKIKVLLLKLVQR